MHNHAKSGYQLVWWKGEERRAVATCASATRYALHSLLFFCFCFFLIKKRESIVVAECDQVLQFLCTNRMWAQSLLYRYEIPLAVAGVVLVRWLPALISPRPAVPAREPPRPIPRAAKCLLLVTSLYHLYRLVFPPYDLFIHNNLDILAPNTLLRDALGDYSPLQDLLLTRLKVLDNRYLYARLGHGPMLECLWCTHALDYFLFALPCILLPYLCEALVLGVLGWRVVGGPWAERRTERWRGTVAWTLVGAAVAEMGVKWGWEVVAVQGDCAHVRANTIYTHDCS